MLATINRLFEASRLPSGSSTFSGETLLQDFHQVDDFALIAFGFLDLDNVLATRAGFASFLPSLIEPEHFQFHRNADG